MNINIFLSNEEKAILDSSIIGIAGTGGIGSNCAMHLVRSGCKNLILVDFDVVEPSNLNRQFFFKKQLGMSKVQALAENLLMINPELNLDIHKVELSNDNIKKIFSNCNILAEAFDNVASKSMLLSAMMSKNIPIVTVSGIAGFGKSNDIRLRKVGKSLYLIGDCISASSNSLAPVSPRVGIASAMQANTIISLLLGKKI